MLDRMWWYVRLGIATVCQRLFHLDQGGAIRDLAFEAGWSRRHKNFLRTIGMVSNLDQWDARTVAKAAMFYHAAKEKAQAQRLFAVAMEKAHDDFIVLACYGKYLKESGRAREAVAQLQQAVQERPDDVTTVCWLGDTYFDLGDLGKAQECYEKCLKLQADWGAAYVGLANVAMHQEDWKEAARLWREAIKRMPQEAYLWRGLGQALFELGDLKGAISAYDMCIRSGDPQENSWAFGGLAECYLARGDFRRAAKSCKQALRWKPGHQPLLDLMQEIEQAATAHC
ncbi:MAG: tetratricopeptide repeat protein [Planctomycetota bacterium]|nr:tetratricopeptide repeat protein [Planctomycetota bacterium]